MASKNEKALAKGTEFPPLEKGVLRLYSMRFCPFAQRTRLVLAHKNIQHETINVHLKAKPDWFLERNPLGLVPVLEQDDKVVYESPVCDNYLDDLYPQKKLTPSDPYVKARHHILMELFGKVITNFYKFFRSPDDEKPAALQDLLKTLQPFEDALQGKYFGGDDPAMVDFHIWPWMERLDLVGQGSKLVPAEKFPKVVSWAGTMMALPAVKETYFDMETHKKFFASYVAGKPEYDIGLGV